VAVSIMTPSRYRGSSWQEVVMPDDPSLEEVGQLKYAIDANDLSRVQELLTRNRALHRAPLGYNQNGPLTWAAECRGQAVTPERLAIVQWMLENGSDVHQGGDGPLMRAALSDERIPMMELLITHGANVNALWNGHYPIIFAPCETLAPESLRYLISCGADMDVMSGRGDCVQMLIATYVRDPDGKHGCLEVFADAGYEFPDTAPMAIHRGRIDLLAECLKREPTLLTRQFSQGELYPLIDPKDGLHVAPLEGATLLHMAVEYQELKIAKWLIEKGADVNARAAIDAEGFGGHTPLFHTTVTLLARGGQLARLLLENGADPNARTTFRKQLQWNGDPEKERMHEYHNVTAIGFARQFQEPPWVNEAAITAIQDHGGS
jgi:ankyrin repeat protein